jgi:hypothetical protein
MSLEYYFVQSLGPGERWNIRSEPLFNLGTALLVADRFIETNNTSVKSYNSIEIRIKNSEGEWKMPYGQLLYEAELDKVSKKIEKKQKDLNKLEKVLTKLIALNQITKI